MKRFRNVTIGLGVLGAILLMSGYLVDHHRCKRVNYERVAYQLPGTWIISAKQCIAAANAIKLRGYAREV